MKKLRLLALVLCAGLALSGCGSMLERSYSTSADHVDYSVTEDSSILRAESYQALLNSILYYVSEHSGGGTIRLYNYPGNVETDLATACKAVMEEDPLGAYAVSGIDYESTRIMTYYEVEVRISYRYTSGEVSAIKPVSGQAGVRNELSRLVDGQLSHSVLRTAYFTGDVQQVSSLFWLAFYSNPVAAYAAPDVDIAFYPEESSQRILEIQCRWPVGSALLENYQSALDSAVTHLMEAAPPIT